MVALILRPESQGRVPMDEERGVSPSVSLEVLVYGPRRRKNKPGRIGTCDGDVNWLSNSQAISSAIFCPDARVS
jgi:hypothetical protein